MLLPTSVVRMLCTEAVVFKELTITNTNAKTEYETTTKVDKDAEESSEICSDSPRGDDEENTILPRALRRVGK